jgi:methyl-accepting chemotaxis protein
MKNKRQIKRSHSIRFKLISAFLLPIAFIIILGAVCYQLASRGMRENYENNSVVSMDMMGEYYELGLSNISGKAIQLIADDTIQKYYQKYYENNHIEEISRFKETQKKILSMAAADKFISNIYVFADYGNPVTSAGTLKTDIYSKFNESSDPIFFKDSDESQIWLGTHPFLDSIFPEQADKYSMTYIKKMSNSGFKHIGYIVIDVSGDFIKDILNKTDFGVNSITGLVTMDGKQVLTGKFSSDFNITQESFYTKAMNNEKDLDSFYVTFQNESYLFIYSKLKEGNSLIFTLIPKTEVIKQAENVKVVTLIIVLLTSFIALIIGFILSNGIGKTIHRTNKTLAMISTGNLNVDARIKRKDEFHILGSSINHMLESMKSLISSMLGVSNKTAISANHVSHASEIILNTSKNIASAVSDIEQGVSQQAMDAENCLQQMANLAEEINSVQENTKSIGEIADSAKEIVNDGQISMNDLSDIAKDTRDVTKNVIESIESLEKESNAIIGIVRVINDITEQTNLLALNASIEAARAGFVGKGFAVVADEIRKLAEQSSNEAGRIRSIVEKIHERTKNTVDVAMKAEKIVSAQESTLTETRAKFDSINEHVSNLSINLNKITNGIEKIAVAKNDTLAAIESISSTLEETAAASAELGVTAENQLISVEELNHEAIQLGEEAKNLEDRVRIFQI